jgi:rhodanese-related sulfurtransferase
LSFPVAVSDDKKVQQEVIKSLKMLKLFSKLSEEELLTLVCSSTLYLARENDVVASKTLVLRSFLVLIEGQLLLEKGDSSHSHQYNRKISTGMQQCLISPHIEKNNSSLSALVDSYYILLSPETVDSMVSRFTLTSGEKFSSVLELIKPELAQNIKQKLVTKTVKKGQTLVQQGDAASEFFIINKGEADVIRHNLLDGNHHLIAKLTGGDSFGEEALLQDISRNAEVRMSTDGEVGILSKQNFDEYLRPLMAPAINTKEAIKLIESGVAKWLDCRFEPEYNSGTLTGALLMPLTKVRQKAHELDDQTTYIAYCNNGRRSQAVTFLLRERSKQVVYLEGGLKSSELYALLGVDSE